MPRTTIGTSWPGMALGEPSLLNLPMRGPRIHGPGQGRDAACHVHDARTGKVDMSIAQAEVHAQVGEPAAAPDPAAIDRVDEDRHEETVDARTPRTSSARPCAPVGIVAAVSMKTIWNRKSVRTVVSLAGAGQEKALVAEQLERLAEELESTCLSRMFGPSNAPSDRPQPPAMMANPRDPEAKHTDRRK